MARQRIHNSRAGSGSGNAGASWISYSDLMCALLLMFVLMLSVILYQYFTMMETKSAELDQQKLLIIDQQTMLDEQTLQLASQQVTLDHQNAQIAVIMTQLDEQKLELENAYIILGENQAELEQARTDLADKEAELIILQQDLANKENALNAAMVVLNQQQAALEKQTEKIEDMVGMRTQIISDLSVTLARANLSAMVDEDGNITLDSSVMFDSGKSTIKAEGKAFLDRFIPVYLEVLMREEYRDYLGQIIIEGHTDDTGTYENNLKLSQERALEVSLYVLSKYPADSPYAQVRAYREMLEQILTATGRSDSDLIYYSNGAINRDASRRVEFKFSLKDAEMIEEMNQLLQGN
ncbi:MAG: OmpA family protein [Clostridia bacterium]|nr:OmpA family protein [Clostridia bacterium]